MKKVPSLIEIIMDKKPEYLERIFSSLRRIEFIADNIKIKAKGGKGK